MKDAEEKARARVGVVRADNIMEDFKTLLFAIIIICCMIIRNDLPKWSHELDRFIND